MKRAVWSLVLLWPALAAADGTERRLHPQKVEASSFLWNDWNRFQENYHPLYAVDDDPRTAWVEGAASSGAGEWIRLHVTRMEGATKVRLKLRAGYQKSDSLFKANARPREITVTLLPGGTELKATLADAEGWQEVIAEQPAGKLEAVQIRVGSVYEGTKYKDLCLSDVQIYVTATTRDNPAFEKSKLDATLAWKADRLAAAKVFQKQAASELAVLPAYHYDYKADPTFAKRWGASLAVADRAAGDRAGFVPAQIVPIDTRPVPTIDGLRVPTLYDAVEWSFGGNGMELPILDSLAALRADQLGTFEVKEKVAYDEVMKTRPPGCHSKRGATFAWVLKEKSSEGKDILRGLLLLRCGRIEVRDGHDDVAQLQVAVYDDAGRLSLVAGPGYVNGFEWSSKERPLLTAGRAVLVDGGTASLASPEVAKLP
jgi:hypothetical protein